YRFHREKSWCAARASGSPGAVFRTSPPLAKRALIRRADCAFPSKADAAHAEVESMKLQNAFRTASGSLAVLLLGVAAQAAPITMLTSGGGSPATLDGVIGSFELSLQSGETATNTLV